MSVFTHPLLILQKLDQRYRNASRSTPTPHRDNDGVKGLGLILDQQLLLINSADIRELSRFTRETRVSKVPGTRPWFLGLSSRHGKLLPLIDFSAYLLEKPTEIKPGTRIIITGSGNLSAGLLVREVTNLKRFTSDQQVNEISAFPDEIQRYLSATFRDGAQCWGQLSMHKLFQDPRFVNAVGA